MRLTSIHVTPALQAGAEQPMHGLCKPPSTVGERQVGYTIQLHPVYRLTDMLMLSATELLSVLNAQASIGGSSDRSRRSTMVD